MAFYEKEFDIIPFTIKYANRDTLRVYINSGITHSIGYQMREKDTHSLEITHYTRDNLCTVVAHHRFIPFNQILDVVYSDLIDNEDEQIGMAIWSNEEGGRIMVTENDVGNF